MKNLSKLSSILENAYYYTEYKASISNLFKIIDESPYEETMDLLNGEFEKLSSNDSSEYLVFLESVIYRFYPGDISDPLRQSQSRYFTINEDQNFSLSFTEYKNQHSIKK